MKRISVQGFALLSVLILSQQAQAEIKGAVVHQGFGNVLVITDSSTGKVIDTIPLRTLRKGSHSYHWTSDTTRVNEWESAGRVTVKEMKARLPSNVGNMGGGVYTATGKSGSMSYGDHVFEFEAPEDEQIISSQKSFDRLCKAAQVPCSQTDVQYKEFLIKSGVEGIKDFGHMRQDYIVWLDPKATSKITRSGHSMAHLVFLKAVTPTITIDDFRYANDFDASPDVLNECHDGLCEISLDRIQAAHTADGIAGQAINIDVHCPRNHNTELKYQVPATATHRFVKIDCKSATPSISLYEKAQVYVVEATYGEGLPDVVAGNATAKTAAYCDGHQSCGYKIAQRFLPPVASPQPKAFRVRWRCFADPSAEIFEKFFPAATAEGTTFQMDCKDAKAPAAAAGTEAPPAEVH